MTQPPNTPLNADDELRGKLRELGAFKNGFGFDASELVKFILADRKKHELQATIEILQEVHKLGHTWEDSNEGTRYELEKMYSQLKQELESYEQTTK